MIQWSDEYAIGVPEIDEQHKHLFDIANRMYELLRNDLILDKYNDIIAILEELKEYTIYHFHAEEEYMKKIGYRKLLSQMATHKDFLDKIDTIDLDRIDNGQNEYLLEMLDFVCDWLAQHIIKEDKLITAD
ncbi:MAG: bacteriohemerythrin [Sporomusaceae bacterium]|nr:bacteriohemerythrin [Sporomusaceae bacterium]